MSKLLYYRLLIRYLNLVLLKRKTIGRTFEKMAAKYPRGVCCRFEGEDVTYAEMNRRVNRRANCLRTMGVAKGDVVCLLMENRPEFLETTLATAKLGAVSALINHHLRGHSLAHTINMSEAGIIIVGRECLERLDEVLPELKHIPADRVLVDTRWDGNVPAPAGLQDLNALLTQAGDADPQAPSLNSRDAALYIYTSGTTGLPKAAVVNHLRWYAAGLGFGTYALEVKPRDVVFCALPMYHSNGILIAFGASLVNGATLGLSRQFSASRFWDELVAQEATCFIYIGEVLRYLINHEPSPAEQEHKVTRILGNGLRPDIWPAVQERFRIPTIREFYASTEGNAVTINVDSVTGSVGTPVLKSSDNTALVRFDVESEEYLRDADGFCQQCAPGEVGELLGEIKVTTPFYGYTNEEETGRKILRNVFKEGDAYFRTGDLLKKDEQGYYYFIDRIGDTFRWKGENVSTQEVQEIIATYEGVEVVNVYGVELPGSEGRLGMASLTLADPARFDGKAFFEFAQANLPNYAMPGFVRLAAAMELTGTFKLRKTDWRKQGFDPAAMSDPLYYLDHGQAAYLPLDTAAHRSILAGEVRF